MRESNHLGTRKHLEGAEAHVDKRSLVVEMTLSATDLWWKAQTELRKTKEATIKHQRSSRAMGSEVENFSG